MTPISRKAFLKGMLAGGAALAAPRAIAQAGKLTLYMGPPEPTCAALAEGFEKSAKVKPTFLRLSAGEAINRIRAERASPHV